MINQEKREGDTVEDESNGNSDSDLPPTEASKIISNLFLFKMPNDFYKFYEFCASIFAKDPCSALKLVNLKLVGPYDVLSGKISAEQPDDPEKYLRHWRYFYDPPEFQVRFSFCLYVFVTHARFQLLFISHESELKLKGRVGSLRPFFSFHFFWASRQ